MIPDPEMQDFPKDSWQPAALGVPSLCQALYQATGWWILILNLVSSEWIAFFPNAVTQLNAFMAAFTAGSRSCCGGHGNGKQEFLQPGREKLGPLEQAQRSRREFSESEIPRKGI